jgi:hypothetical protein
LAGGGQDEEYFHLLFVLMTMRSPIQRSYPGSKSVVSPNPSTRSGLQLVLSLNDAFVLPGLSRALVRHHAGDHFKTETANYPEEFLL